MRRHSHHRALAIAHQHIVGHPDFELRARQRMDHVQAGRHTALLGSGEICLHDAAALTLIDEGRELRIVACGCGGQRMLGRHCTVGRAQQRICAGSKYF